MDLTLDWPALKPHGIARYVEDDRGDYLLVGIATGVILGIILGAN